MVVFLSSSQIEGKGCKRIPYREWRCLCEREFPGGICLYNGLADLHSMPVEQEKRSW